MSIQHALRNISVNRLSITAYDIYGNVTGTEHLGELELRELLNIAVDAAITEKRREGSKKRYHERYSPNAQPHY